MKLVFFLLLATTLFITPALGQDYFGNWPAGSSPRELGKRLAENWVKRDFEFQSGKRQFLIYPEACAWYGSLVTAKLLKEKDLQSRLAKEFDRFLTADGAKNISPADHVDYHVIGIVPLEIGMQTNDKKYLDFGRGFAPIPRLESGSRSGGARSLNPERRAAGDVSNGLKSAWSVVSFVVSVRLVMR